MNFGPEIGFHRYAPAAFLNVDGPDAPTFLQGQFTNDLSKLPGGAAVYGLWLDRKGRVLGDSTVIRRPDGAGYWIASQDFPAAQLARHLNDHLIADEVEIRDETEGWRGVALLGPGSGAALAAVPRSGCQFPGRRGEGESWEWLYPRSAEAEVAAALPAANELSAAQLELRRIRAGLPRVGTDIGAVDLPNEGGLEAVAISYSKGCYLGQEVMARVKNRGRVRRGLVRVTGPWSPPPLPAALWNGATKAGELRSAVAVPGGGEGLALVAVDPAAAPARLALAPGGPPVVALHRP